VPEITGTDTFDWGNMIDNYFDDYWQPIYNEKQAEAIARLMYECGVSVKMDYTPDGSGASVGNSVGPVVALRKYFNYDSKIEAIWKDNYKSDWESKLREELDAGRPVFYAGFSDDNSSGHAFVCDGYQCKDNTFNFNWGWGGSCDGYFTISLLNPSRYDFSYNQYIVANIQPNPKDYEHPATANNVSSFSVTASATIGGTINPAGVSYVYLGENQTVLFIANAGYEIDEVLVGNTPSATAKANGYHIFKNIDENKTIAVTFKVISETTHIISASTGENGNIMPNGNVTVIESVNQPFIFVSDVGYEINQVLIDGAPNAEAKSNGYHIFPNVTAAHTIKVTFKKIETTAKTYTISASAAANGSITPSGDIIVSEGASRTFAFEPNSGYEIKEVLICGNVNEQAKIDGRYTLTATQNCDILVTFQAKTTGIGTIDENQLIIYPNPTTGIVNISEPSEIKVYNSFGALLITTFGTQVDLSNYANGVYFIQANGKRTSVVKK
jgi:hypothetical protein